MRNTVASNSDSYKCEEIIPTEPRNLGGTYNYLEKLMLEVIILSPYKLPLSYPKFNMLFRSTFSRGTFLVLSKAILVAVRSASAAKMTLDPSLRVQAGRNAQHKPVNLTKHSWPCLVQVLQSTLQLLQHMRAATATAPSDA